MGSSEVVEGRTIAEQMQALGMRLPKQGETSHPYQSAVVVGTLIFLSGKIALREDGSVLKGVLGAHGDIEAGQEAARLCALQCLSALETAVGLGAVERLVTVEAYVASTPEFDEHPMVANAASEMFIAVLGNAGHHARTAVGVSALPRQSMVELKVTASLREEVSAH